MEKRTYIWGIGTRVFHALLVFSFIIAYMTSDSDALLRLHASFGILVALLLLFRIPWGFFGPLYSRFKDFDFSLVSLKKYMLGIFGHKEKVPGHNVASSYGMIGILLLGILTGITGLVALGSEEGAGIFGFLYKGGEFYKEAHEICANLFTAIVLVHIAGVLFEHFYHKSGIAKSMLDGYKNLDAAPSKTNFLQSLYLLIWIGVSIVLFIYTVANPKNPLFADKRSNPVALEKNYPLLQQECASCHTLYPPQMLQANSWREMMGELDNHFGDDASLDAQDTAAITDLLLAYSGTSSKLDGGQRITKSSFWKRHHRGMDEDVFESKEIKSPANCKACHQDIEEKGSVSVMSLDLQKVLFRY